MSSLPHHRRSYAQAALLLLTGFAVLILVAIGASYAFVRGLP